MKRNIKIMSLMLIMLLSVSGSLIAQRGAGRMMRDSSGMDRVMRERMRMPLLQHPPDSLLMREMGPGIGHLRMNPGGRGWRQMPGYGMRRGFGPGPYYGMRRGMGQAWMDQTWRHGMGMNRPLLDMIPNLTENQKKEIADLKQKQQDEMKKLREEMSTKMQSLRDAHRTRIMSLLTDEQKKWLEENTPKLNNLPKSGN